MVNHRLLKINNSYFINVTESEKSWLPCIQQQNTFTYTGSYNKPYITYKILHIRYNMHVGAFFIYLFGSFRSLQ